MRAISLYTSFWDFGRFTPSTQNSVRVSDHLIYKFGISPENPIGAVGSFNSLPRRRMTAPIVALKIIVIFRSTCIYFQNLIYYQLPYRISPNAHPRTRSVLDSICGGQKTIWQMVVVQCSNILRKCANILCGPIGAFGSFNSIPRRRMNKERRANSCAKNNQKIDLDIEKSELLPIAIRNFTQCASKDKVGLSVY